MKFNMIVLVSLTALGLGVSGCKPQPETTQEADSFEWQIDRFADLRILRYKVDDFDSLTAKQRVLVYYLAEAAKCGRDILYDQNFKYNLLIRKVLETIYREFPGDRQTDDWGKFEVYLKRVWFANGIHHHYSTAKFEPGFSAEYFAQLVNATPATAFAAELGEPQAIINTLTPIIFDPKIAPIRVNQSPDVDMLDASACNYYQGVSQHEAEKFYRHMQDAHDKTPISYGLNSTLVNENGTLREKVWKIDGMYGPAIKKIVFWLKKAATVAENPHQQKVIETLIDFYQTGDLHTFDQYNILWVNDLDSHVDFVNGFIENYGDPLGYKASWESVVNFKNIEASHRTEVISKNAQWFEDHSPVDPQFRKKTVKGISAKVITVAQFGGDCFPTAPLGINLPNADWIRKEHGSKSVSIDNVGYAYDQALKGSGFEQEFAWSQEIIERGRLFGVLGDNLHTDLHECLGHASGQLAPGIKGDELKNYGSTLEEARADLFALYYIMDPQLIELGLIPSLEVGKSQYDSYLRNGLLTQLVRIEPGKNIEEAHMRNRQLIAKWCFEKGADNQVVELKKRDGKTFVVINDYDRLRTLFGDLLREIQRIKSTGDFEAGKQLVETYGVKVDADLHREVLQRYEKLNQAPYSGFVNPNIIPVYKGNEVVDARIEYPENYVQQMLDYSSKYSFLPVKN